MLGGFDTLIYAFPRSANRRQRWRDRSILRVFRDARGPERAQYGKGSFQNAVAALGFPTPRILLTCLDRAVIGGAFLVMPRLPGRVMLDAFFSPRVVRMPALLAALQARLHGLDADAFRQHLTATRYAAERLTIAGSAPRQHAGAYRRRCADRLSNPACVGRSPTVRHRRCTRRSATATSTRSTSCSTATK